MRYESEEHAVVERLADLLLGEKLPLDIWGKKGDEVIIPAGKKISKDLLKKVYEAAKAHELEIDPSPIRIRVFETIEKAINDFEKYGPAPKQADPEIG
jgi:DNA-directed RNA polymerase subunit beta